MISSTVPEGGLCRPAGAGGEGRKTLGCATRSAAAATTIGFGHFRCDTIGPVITVILCTYAALLGAEPTGQIAFVSGTEQEDRRVEIIELATGAVAPLGPGDRDGAPVWSPDGQWLAFPTKGPDGMVIRIVRADGSEARNVPHKYAWNDIPRWSPDGSLVAYTGTNGADDIRPEDMAKGSFIMVYNVAGNTEEQWGGDAMSLYCPVWMDAGTIIAIGVLPGQKRLTTHIFFVNPGDANPLPPEAMPSAGEYIEWAPDANIKRNLLAYDSNDGGDREVFVLSYKRGSTDVSNHRAADWNPVWQPGGEWLAFESFRSGRRGVYRVFPSTIRVFPVAVGENYDNWHPAWSPDGAFLAYVSDRLGTPQIFVTEIESGQTREATTGGRFALSPAWRPAP
ncbi:MAG TPA: hypothetical protein PLJ71_06120 [Candidatus Hydrogenedentes bacterium]|nr:hypothetical protein [Candidatus Hydrogenedentota bacterium]HQM48245.1 hypothetical protein [Candidatus Hydrogenedentota bacterium]